MMICIIIFMLLLILIGRSTLIVAERSIYEKDHYHHYHHDYLKSLESQVSLLRKLLVQNLCHGKEEISSTGSWCL